MSEPAPSHSPVTKSTEPRPVDATDNPVHCAKCYQFNSREADKCAKCGAHLWIKCRKCGKKNVRTASRCMRCLCTIHALSFLPSFRLNRLFRNRKKKRLLRALSVFAAAALLAWLIYQNLPEPGLPVPNPVAAPSS